MVLKVFSLAPPSVLCMKPTPPYTYFSKQYKDIETVYTSRTCILFSFMSYNYELVLMTVVFSLQFNLLFYELVVPWWSICIYEINYITQIYKIPALHTVRYFSFKSVHRKQIKRIDNETKFYLILMMMTNRYSFHWYIQNQWNNK